MIRTADTCPTCGDNINLAEVHGTWIAACDAECFVGEGDVPEDALTDWSTRAGASRAPTPTALASFIVPRDEGRFTVELANCWRSCVTLESAERHAEAARTSGFYPSTITWEPRRAPALEPITTNLPEEIAL
jgi:hypothetical protein